MKNRSMTGKFLGVALAAALSVGTLTVAARAQEHENHGQQPQQQQNFHFQDQHRTSFQQHYGSSAQQWAHNDKRVHFEAGQKAPANYRFQTVPTSYYRGAPPPPPGYRYGYYQGYVVAYNPTTRIIADVLDLATGQ